MCLLNKTTFLALGLLFVLTACGGGGGSSGGGSSNNVAGCVNPTPVNLGITANFSINDTTSYQGQKSNFRLNRRYGFEDHQSDSAVGMALGISAFHAIAYGDFDDDGDIDFFQSGIANPTSDHPHFYRQDITGEFILEDSFIIGGAGMVHPRKAIVADFDKNDIPDVVVFNTGLDKPPFPGGLSTLFLSDGNNLIASDQLDNYLGYFHSGTAGDIDNDGDVDILMGDANGFYFLINDGNAKFSKADNRINCAVSRGYFTSELIDVDRDGYLDLIVAGDEYSEDGVSNVETAYIMYGSSTGYYSNPTSLPGKTGFGVILDADAEDINGDNITDIVLLRTGDIDTAIYEGFYIQLLVGLGDGNFTDQSNMIEKRTSWVYSDKGLVSEQLLNIPVEMVATTITNNAGGPDAWIDFIRMQDVNSDNLIDIIEDQDGRNLTWINNGDGSFNAQFNFVNENNPSYTSYD